MNDEDYVEYMKKRKEEDEEKEI